MIIVFEGHDRSGKTTISDALAKRLGTEVFMPNTKECFTDKQAFTKDSSAIARFNYFLSKYIKNLHDLQLVKKPIIIYRSFLSEMVYAELFERRTDDFINSLTDIVLARLNTLVIVCKNESRAFYDDDILSDPEVIKSIELFDKYKQTISCKYVDLDTTEYDTEKHVENILREIKNHEDRNI